MLRSTMTAVPQLPWSAAGGLVLYAALLFVGAWTIYDRVHRKGRGVEPLRAVRWLVLGKASALVGAMVVGAYAGFGVRRQSLVPGPSMTEQELIAFLSAGAAALVVVAALLLERACKTPKGTDDDPAPTDDDHFR